MDHIYNFFNTIGNYTLIKNKPDNDDILNYIQQVFLVIKKIHITKTTCCI